MLKYIVGMVGARRDFDVAKILFENKCLEHLFVDTAYKEKRIFSLIPFIGKNVRNKLNKYITGIESSLVSSDWVGAFVMRMLLKYSSKSSAYHLANIRLGKRTIDYCKKISPRGYYGFDTSSLEFMEWAHKKEWVLVLEQCVAPRASQIDMYKAFQLKYGLNYERNINHCLFQQQREQKEWQLASKIIVPSNYVKLELLKTRLVSEEKIEVVSFGYTNHTPFAEIKELIEKKQIDKDKPIQILFAGNAGYRKGIIDIIEIAEKLSSENVIFKIAGHLEPEANFILKNNKNPKLAYLGKLNKQQLVEQYKESDIFFFPSYLEGSAMVLLEAMSWGLPIVTTYQSGSIVQEGVTGFISDAGNIESLMKGLYSLILDSELRYKMSVESLNTSKDYSIEKYSENLLKILKH